MKSVISSYLQFIASAIFFLSIALCLFVSGCAAQRAAVAQDAQSKMVGMTKEQVLSCMGAPANKASEGQTEVWTYKSGNGATTVSSFSTANAMVSGTANAATGSGFGSSVSTASKRYCIVNVVMTSGSVSKVNYSGPTGGLITGGEQCAFVVRNCVQ